MRTRSLVTTGPTHFHVDRTFAQIGCRHLGAPRLDEPLRARVQTLTSSNRSGRVHRESTGFLLAAAERDAVADGENLIIDGTLAWKGHAARLLTHLQQACYTIHVVDVEAPQHAVAGRILSRWRRGPVQATAVDALFTDFREPDLLPLRGRSVT